MSKVSRHKVCFSAKKTKRVQFSMQHRLKSTNYRATHLATVARKKLGPRFELQSVPRRQVESHEPLISVQLKEGIKLGLLPDGGNLEIISLGACLSICASSAVSRLL